MNQTGLLSLFVSAFISATIAPGGSEILLGYLVTTQQYSNFLLWLVATFGNTLGAFTTLYLGRLMARGMLSEKLKRLVHQHSHALEYVRRWGILALFFSWLPLVGDGFCFAAGYLELSVVVSTLAIFIGKALRYALVIYSIG